MTAAIRALRIGDAAAIAAIYARYVAHGVASFEEVPPDADEMARRIATGVTTHPWFAAERDGALIGYAYGRAYHPRAAYRWTCETGIYLAHDARRGGIGRALYETLLAELTRRGFVAAIASITVPNAQSTRFHEALGFRAIGIMPGIGYKFGAWRDVGYWQRDLAPRTDAPAAPACEAPPAR